MVLKRERLGLSSRVPSIPAIALIILASPSLTLGGPLAVTDQNPLLSGFLPPAALPADLRGAPTWQLEADLAWGSTAILQTQRREALVVDAETRELRVTIQHSLADGLALRIQIPYRYTGGGTLDGFIDDWHETFGLPQGARPSLPEDRFAITYRRDRRTLIDAHEARTSLGDVSIQVGRELYDSPHSSMTLWAALELPTGDVDAFAGSGSIDTTLALAARRTLGDRFAVFGQLAGTWLTEGDRLSDLQRDVVWAATAGVDARVFRRMTFTLQLDAHSEVFDSNLKFLGSSTMLSIGATYRTDGWELTLGLIEDIAAETAPDVVFLFGAKRPIQ